MRKGSLVMTSAVLKKYTQTQWSKLLSLLLVAAKRDRWYTVEQLATIMECSRLEIHNEFEQIKKHPYKLRKRREVGVVGGAPYEYQVESLK